MVKSGFKGAATGANIASLSGQGTAVLMGRPTEEINVIAAHLKQAQETGNKIDLTGAAIDTKAAEKESVAPSPALSRGDDQFDRDFGQQDVKPLWG